MIIAVGTHVDVTQNLLESGVAESEQDFPVMTESVFISSSYCEPSNDDSRLVIVEKGTILPCNISYTLDSGSATAYFGVYASSESRCLGHVSFNIPSPMESVQLEVRVQVTGSMQLSVFAGKSLLQFSRFDSK